MFFRGGKCILNRLAFRPGVEIVEFWTKCAISQNIFGTCDTVGELIWDFAFVFANVSV